MKLEQGECCVELLHSDDATTATYDELDNFLCYNNSGREALIEKALSLLCELPKEQRERILRKYIERFGADAG